MAKYSYTCKCNNFTLHRGKLTRRQYAAEKVVHAKACPLLAQELEKSKVVSKHGGKKE